MGLDGNRWEILLFGVFSSLEGMAGWLLDCTVPSLKPALGGRKDSLCMYVMELGAWSLGIGDRGLGIWLRVCICHVSDYEDGGRCTMSIRLGPREGKRKRSWSPRD
jgi:hypothetical protein